MEGSSQIESLLMLGAVTADGNSTPHTLGSSEIATTLWPGTATHSEEINTESPCRQYGSFLAGSGSVTALTARVSLVTLQTLLPGGVGGRVEI